MRQQISSLIYMWGGFVTDVCYCKQATGGALQHPERSLMRRSLLQLCTGAPVRSGTRWGVMLAKIGNSKSLSAFCSHGKTARHTSPTSFPPVMEKENIRRKSLGREHGGTVIRDFRLLQLWMAMLQQTRDKLKAHHRRKQRVNGSARCLCSPT